MPDTGPIELWVTDPDFTYGNAKVPIPVKREPTLPEVIEWLIERGHSVILNVEIDWDRRTLKTTGKGGEQWWSGV